MGKLTYKTAKDHKEWLELRRQGIGGSDAAAIVNLNPNCSARSVYLDKLGLLPEFEGNEATRQGSDLEEYVARRFTEATGKKVRRRNKIIRNSDYPFAHANVDRWITGENAGLECKTTSTLNLGKFKNGEFPVNYYIQCLHYMAVTGAERYYLAVLIFGKEFHVYEFERDEEEIADLMQAEEFFWENLKEGNPPPVEGMKDTDWALSVQYDNPQDDLYISLYGMNGKADELLELKEKKKDLEQQIREIEQEFKDMLGNAVVGETDTIKVSWKPQTRKTFQTKAFIADHPEIDFDPYYKESTSRVFRIKEMD